MAPTGTQPPTRKRQAYLRTLAQRTGQTFIAPRTSREASAEIRRLRAAASSSRVELAIERRDWAAEQAAREANCDVPIGPEEIEGYGSTATWRGAPLMCARTDTAPLRNGVGRRVELGRYRVGSAERVIVGQRVNGVVRVSDVPASGHGRGYLVERELEQDGHGALKALVADYIDQATRHRRIPMDVPLERYLAHAPASGDAAGAADPSRSPRPREQERTA